MIYTQQKVSLFLFSTYCSQNSEPKKQEYIFQVRLRKPLSLSVGKPDNFTPSSGVNIMQLSEERMPLIRILKILEHKKSGTSERDRRNEPVVRTAGTTKIGSYKNVNS